MSYYEEYMAECTNCPWASWADGSLHAAAQAARKHSDEKPTHRIRINGVDLIKCIGGSRKLHADHPPARHGVTR